MFNALTGAHQRVANYPGITVEKREGYYSKDGQRVEILDLPGTYSLSSFSPEERVAQDELLNGGADVVVAVVDSVNLSRSLMLVAQLMQFEVNLVLCLNMSDEAQKAGQKLNLPLLEQLVGCPVVETVGTRKAGISDLQQAISHAAGSPPQSHSRLVLGRRLEEALRAIQQRLCDAGIDSGGGSWFATKLLLDDAHFQHKVRSAGSSGEVPLQEARRQRQRIEEQTGTDISLYVMEQYRGFVDGLLEEVTIQRAHRDVHLSSHRVDTVLAHRVVGLPIFLLLMYGIFWTTFTMGEIPMSWLEEGVALLSGAVAGLWPVASNSALRSLLVDGVIGGVGGVVVFLPNIVLLFLCLAILEDTGYMARVAFLLDGVMHRFGLHGKSFVPLMTGFGCSIPGIMATRTLDSDKDRLATMMVLPLMSCGARLPIWMLLIPAFFAPAWRAPMLWTIYMVGIALALVLALVLRRTLLRGEEAPFVMELPPYRLPTIKGLLTRMVERSWLYLRKAGTVILSISILLWAATTYPRPEQYSVDRALAEGTLEVVAAHQLNQASLRASGVARVTSEQLSHLRKAEAMRYSLAGRFGLLLEPALRPLGFDWKIGTAMLGTFAAKEMFVAQMGIIFSLGEVDEDTQSLQQSMRSEYSPLTGLSLMLFLLIAAPCMATVAVTRRESGSWRWALLQLAGLTAAAYLISLAVYQLGSLVLSWS